MALPFEAERVTGRQLPVGEQVALILVLLGAVVAFCTQQVALLIITVPGQRALVLASIIQGNRLNQIRVVFVVAQLKADSDTQLNADQAGARIVVESPLLPQQVLNTHWQPGAAVHGCQYPGAAIGLSKHHLVIAPSLYP